MAPRLRGPDGADGGPEAHALRVLEFGDVLEILTRWATSEPGRRHIRELRPWKDAAAVEAALGTTDEMVGFLLAGEAWAPPPIPDLAGPIRRLGADASVLDVEELSQVAVLLISSRRARGDLRRSLSGAGRLASLAAKLAREPGLEELLARSLDPAGGLSDRASPELGRLRESLKGSRAALVRRLESFMRSLPAQLQVADASVTVRSGRYCIPIRREGLSRVSGIVHDESATHRTLFVEPTAAIAAMNRIAELEREEARETQRILRELSEKLRPHAESLAVSLAVLAEVDSVYARARFALEHGGSRPQVEAGACLSVTGATHPLLWAAGEPVVPFDLELHSDERVLLVSGPNAGGKTVLLKALGLVSAMAQSGIVPPTAAGTRLPLFRSFFALVGDEQSIQASLSTFSAQVEGLRVILEQADRDSLVLVDELGGNTDPAEGAALAAAVLLRLARQGGVTVATTHLGELKELASEDPAVVNASLQFDTTALRPTFRLRRDRPGRSYALEIACRLGLPADVLDVAHGRLSDEQRDVERLLGELEDREAEATRLVAESRSIRHRLEGRETELAERERKLEGRLRELERGAITRAERYVLEARKRVAEVIERLREEVAAASSGGGAVNEAMATARASVEGMLRDLREQRPDTAQETREGAALSYGDQVRSRTLSVEGRVVELRDDVVVVESGGVRWNLPPGDLDPVAPGPKETPSRPAGLLPDLGPRPEVDIRGLRVDEVEGALATSLDAAFVSDLGTLRIIHGKGTGVLREEVRRLLARDGRIARYREGGFEEGGSGVTVVEFRSDGG